jgi:hypothetical protein
MSETNPRDEAAHAFKQAKRAAKSGDLAAAERWSKTAERLAGVAARLAHAPQDAEMDEGEEERRAELRRRLARFVEADLDIQAWERERSEHSAQCLAALANGLPPPAPLRPHPAGAQGEEAYMAEILVGQEENR